MMINKADVQTIKTERLVLRQIRPDDYEDFYNFCCSRERVAKYVSWNVHENIEKTRERTAILVERYNSSNPFIWAIEYKGRVIGNFDVVDMTDSTAYLGWMISDDYWNMGIMTEVACALRNYLFDVAGFERIEASHISENVASGRIMQKIGMNRLPNNRYKESFYYKKHSKNECRGMPLTHYILTKEEYKKLTQGAIL